MYNYQMNHGFIAIAQTLLQIFEDDTDVYWMAKGFYHIVEQFKQDIPKLVERTLLTLEKEDYKLNKHLENIKILNLLPLSMWFESCFAGVLNETAIAKYVECKNIEIVLFISKL